MQILIAGDFCPQADVERAILGGQAKSLFDDWEELLSTVDYSVVNFECPIVEEGDVPIKKAGPHLCTKQKVVTFIKELGFKMVTLANNHFFDYGQVGVGRTIEALKSNGIEYVGGGYTYQEANKILYKSINDKVAAFINVCENEFSLANENHGGSKALDPVNNYYDICQAKEKADYVIVIVHGGHEYYQLPSPGMVRNYRFFVEAGADAVINHHQHCYSGYEVYKNAPIFYGLGNFNFCRKKYKDNIWNAGFAVTLILEDNNVSFKLHPYKQCNGNFSTNILKNDTEFYQHIKELNLIIKDAEKLALKFEDWVEYIWNKNFKVVFEPYNKPLLRAAYMRNFLPSFFVAEKRLKLLGLLSCQSHYEIVMRKLECLTGKYPYKSVK